MARRHLSLEALRKSGIDYEHDMDPDYVIIKRWVPEWEQDVLWNETRAIRERRQEPVLFETKKKIHRKQEYTAPLRTQQFRG
ncbi:hypothetical protein N431DRAFT_428661 [Stipitochalara longipes BDJ]|nr:hypothetical protein N431DRAFT_428661 [Stipitochalara longipes BDJ]